MHINTIQGLNNNIINLQNRNKPKNSPTLSPDDSIKNYDNNYDHNYLNNYDNNRDNTRRHLIKDSLKTFMYASSCIGLASGIVKMEDYTQGWSAIRRFNNPSHPSIGGMASDELGRTRRFEYDSNPSTPNILSYNEVMKSYRDNNVPAMRGEWLGPGSTEEDVREAALALWRVRSSLRSLSVMCKEYDWEGALELLHSPLLTTTLASTLTTLRTSRGILTDEARSEVGFSWGSCGWRHCGILADVQEALSELECRMGLFEPEECEFCIGVARRGVEEALEGVPERLRGKEIGGGGREGGSGGRSLGMCGRDECCLFLL